MQQRQRISHQNVNYLGLYENRGFIIRFQLSIDKV